MRASFSVKAIAAISVGLALLVTLGLVAYRSVGEFQDAGADVRRMVDVRAQLESIRFDVERAEAIQLRYQLTGDPADPEEFRAMSYRTRGAIRDLERLLMVQAQKERLAELERVVSARFDVLAEAMRLRSAGQSATELLFNSRGVESGRGIGRIADTIAEHERNMIRESEEHAEENAGLLLNAALWGGALAVALLLWAITIVRRYERERTRAEADLRAAQERLALALEGSHAAVWDWDVAKEQVYLSQGWAAMVGDTPQEATISPAELLAWVHPDDAAQVQQAVQRALAGVGAVYREEHRVRHTNGHWIWIASHGKVVQRGAGGEPLRMVGTNQDISTRKHAELALKEHDARLRLALETAGMASWDWDKAADAFVWQDSPGRLLGEDSPGGYPALRDTVHPDDLAHFIRTFNLAVSGASAYRDEFRLKCADGSALWVQAHGYAERDAEGVVTRVMGVVQDISEIKDAEQALRANARQLQLITDSVPAIISYVDAQQRLQFCNRTMCRLLGFRPEDILGRTLGEVLGDERFRELRPMLLRALAGEEVHFERVQMTPGGPVDLSFVYVPRRDENGAVEGFYALGTDISELKRLDRMKSEFVSTVSHELRTPLTSIRGSLGVLAGGVAGVLPEKARGFIDIAKNNCERLIRLINDILDMEKIESGKITFQLRRLDLMELVEQVMKANEGYAGQHKVRLALTSSLPGAQVHADGDRLAQVLTNLVSNACKFSPAGDSVDIAVCRVGARVRVEVSDHGAGIPEEFRGRIFQKFSQADSSDVRQKGGTGLGLSISKAIVEGLGGEIGFVSEVGKGTTFYFLLPEWREAPAEAVTKSSGRPRVLVCEDDPDVGRLLQILVEKAGCSSDLASSAAAAKALLSNGGYAAVTVDLHLPDQNGLALLRDLRANADTVSVPVIVISATAQEGRLSLDGEDLGVVDWLTKPIDEDRLRQNLRTAIGSGANLRVLHVEDDSDVCRVVEALARDVAVFRAAGTVAEARRLLQGNSYDLVLLDLGLPDGSGWDLLPDINRLAPRPRVVIFSASDAGAANETGGVPGYTFLVKSHTSEQQLLQAIGAAAGVSP